MRAFRRHLAFWAAGWLCCQGLAVSATPVAAYELSIANENALPECCRNLKPGQTCPMHQHPHDATTSAADAEHACHLSPACPPLDSALLSLATGLGVPALAPAGATRASVVTPLAVAAPQPIARAPHPDAPPPRA